MWAATAWDDADWPGAQARGWTVMGRLREHQAFHREEAAAARKRQEERRTRSELMTAASMQAAYEDSIKARWKGGPNVLAFLFAHPDSDAMRTLDARGEYFDVRTGDTWDLFFPGYYNSKRHELERAAGARPAGQLYLRGWYFNPRDFDMLRAHIERESEGRWAYSGGTDLVLIGGWLPEDGEPKLDWSSTISGSITDRAEGTTTLTVAGVIERITRDLETAAEDPSYGVGEVVDEAGPERRQLIRDLFVNALGGIAASLGARALGP